MREDEQIAFKVWRVESFDTWNGDLPVAAHYIGTVLGKPGLPYLMVGDLRALHLEPGLFAVKIPDELCQKYVLPEWQKITALNERGKHDEGSDNA